MSKILNKNMFFKEPTTKNLTKASRNKQLNKYLKSQQPNSINQKQQNKQSWLNRLTQKPLLQIIAAQIQDKQQLNKNPIDLNCFDRLKKIFDKKQQEKNKQNNHQQMFQNVIKIQHYLYDMQNKYKRKHKQRNFSCKLEQQNIPRRSLKDSQLRKSRLSGVILPRNANNGSFHVDQKQNKEKLIINVNKQVKKLKQICLMKFVQNKKLIQDNVYQKIQQFIQNILTTKMNQIIVSKMSSLQIIRQKNKSFNEILRQKELQIQCLKSQLQIKQNRIKQRQFQTDEMITYRKKAIQFMRQFQKQFGKINIQQLKIKLNQKQHCFLYNFSKLQKQHLQTVNQIQKQKNTKINQLKNQINQLKKQEQDLKNLILQKQKLKILDNSEETHNIYNKLIQYKKYYDEYMELKNFIINKYVIWNTSKNIQQKKIINITSNNVNDFLQIVQKMVDFNLQHAEKDKNIQYLAKIMGQIQKIKKILKPTISHQKLQPLKTLEDIQNFILKNRKKTKFKYEMNQNNLND